MMVRIHPIECNRGDAVNMRDNSLDRLIGLKPMETQPTRGMVTLVGAGPGDWELLTLKAYRALQSADVVLYDHLVSDEVLRFLPPSAERIYVGKESSRHTMPQEQISEVMIALSLQGRRVLRLKGGDGYIFGRGGEEAQALAAANIPFEVIPGITSAQGASASCGIPLTHRDHSRTLIFATGHLRENHQVDLDWEMLARPKQTVVIYMGIGTLPTIVAQLLAHGLAPDTPAALIERATTARERCVTGTIATLPQLAVSEHVQPPALIVIGHVVSLREVLQATSEAGLTSA